MFRYILVNIFLLLSVTVNGVPAKNQKNWEYTLMSLLTNSSDTNTLEINLKVITLARSSYAISGIFDIKVEADDKYYVEVKLFRSATGGSRYQLMPLNIKNQTLSSFMNNGYKEYVMDSLRDCSNVPQFKDTWNGPQQPVRYIFEKCTIRTDNLPSQMLPGFYKVVISITGSNLQSNIIASIKIESIY